jgi:hypothetical protein
MKTYEIVQNGAKQNIKYYIDGVLDVIEHYDSAVEIRPGYTLKS